MRHHRGRTCLRATVRRRAARNPFTPAVQRPHKQGWVDLFSSVSVPSVFVWNPHCPCLHLCRAAWRQSNRDRLLCLRQQRSIQRTPELSSREGKDFGSWKAWNWFLWTFLTHLSPPARRSQAQDQTHLGPCCPTCPPVAPARPRLMAPARSRRHWQLTSMRTWSDTSRDGLQRPRRSR